MPSGIQARPRRTGKPVVERKKKKIMPNRLKELRERHKADGGFYLTLAEVGRCLRKSEGAVSRQESMERGLSSEDVIAYAKLYKVRESELFVGLTDESRSTHRP